MELRELIKKRLTSLDINIFKRGGEKVPALEIKNKYQKIKNYLSHHQNDIAVAIKLEKDYEYLLVILVSMELGLPFIPLKEDYPQNRIDQIKEDIPFKLLIDQKKIEEIFEARKDLISPKKVEDKDPLYILFTSGSTGKPKGVIIPRRACFNYFKWIDNFFKETNEKDHFLQITEFTFDISLIDIGFFLLKNVHLYFSEFTQDIFKLAFEIEKYKISIISTVPNNLNMLLEDFIASRADYQSLKELLIGGARFSLGLYDKCEKYLKDKNIYNLYGPTECTIYTHTKKISFNKEKDIKDATVSIGKPIKNTLAIIKDNELLLGGIQLMLGYANNEEKTKEVLTTFNKEIYYKTGDIAFSNSEGDYFITGRKDDTIKHRGYRINLLDIDSYISKLSYIEDSVTIAVPDEKKENITVCYLRVKEKKEIADIKKDLEEVLLSYQIPEKFFFIDKYPVNNSGKVDKNILAQIYRKEL